MLELLDRDLAHSSTLRDRHPGCAELLQRLLRGFRCHPGA
jgi:hypothetical protein